MNEHVIGIICPCDIEYEMAKKVLQLRDEKEISGRKVSYKKGNGFNIYTIKTGPGKIQCASGTQLLIDRYNPDIILDTGAAGSLSDNINIFTTVLGVRAYEYDVISTGDMEVIPEDIITKTALSNSKVEKLVKEYINKYDSFIIKTGNIACGEKNVDNKIFRELLYMKYETICCNWETSAVLKTAELNNIESLSFRVITDNADEEMKKNLKNNWKRGMDILYNIINDFINEGWLEKIINNN